MTAPSNRLLRNILRSLVDEYGPADVYQALTKILEKGEEDDPSFEGKRKSRGDRQLNNPIRSKKLNAIDQAKKFLPNSQEPEALLNLAARFDRREFLPHVTDVKEFLARMGAEGQIFRDRMDGFRHVLLVLAQLPSERLKKLSDVNNSSGPAQLAPLAEAIRTAGDAMRRSDYSVPAQAGEPQHNDKRMDAENAPVDKGNRSLLAVTSKVDEGLTKDSSDQPAELTDDKYDKKATSESQAKNRIIKPDRIKQK